MFIKLNSSSQICNVFIYKTCQAYFCFKSHMWKCHTSFFLHILLSVRHFIDSRLNIFTQMVGIISTEEGKKKKFYTYLQNQELFVYPITDTSFVFNLLWKSETLYCVFHKCLCTIWMWRITRLHPHMVCACVCSSNLDRKFYFWQTDYNLTTKRIKHAVL
jgi:hypothetical protein